MTSFRYFIWCGIMAFSVLSTVAQTGGIRGTVIDSKTRTPLASATVVLLINNKGNNTTTRTNFGKITDKQGQFEFKGIPVGSYIVKFTYVSYSALQKNTEVLDKEVVTVNGELNTDVKGLDEVVVTGVASRTQKSVAEVAVARVDAAALSETNSFDGVSQLLQGKVAGVRTSSSSGNVGGGFRFDVRSGAGLNGNGQPTVFVDGVRVENGLTDASVGGQDLSALSLLSSESIESVEILKGPAASALYGTSGSNGVVLIKTKRAMTGVGANNYAIQFKTTHGWNERQADYTTAYSLGADDANRILRKGTISAQAFSIGGNTGSFNYLLGYDRRSEDGILSTNSYVRDAIRGNFSAFASDKLTLNVSTSYTFANNLIPFGDNTVFGFLGETLDYAPKSLGGNGAYFGLDSVAVAALRVTNRQQSFTGSAEAIYVPMKDLSFRGLIGVNTIGTNFNYNVPSNYNYSRYGIVKGTKYISTNEQNAYNFEFAGTYSTQFGDDINSSTVVGLQGFLNTARGIEIQKDSFPSTVLTNLGSGKIYTGGNENFGESRSGGLFIQEEISMSNTYFFSAGLRNDYASAIGKDAATVFYPRASAAVRLDRALELPSSINLFKFRLAYGASGILPGALDGSVLRWGATQTGDGTGATVTSLGNPTLKPETVQEFEVGTEIEFDNSYGLELTYFQQFSSNSIFAYQQAPSIGLPNPFQNIGSIVGSGIEANIYARLFRTEEYQLDLNLITNYANNEVTDLGGAAPIISGENVVMVGQPKAAFYSFPITGALYDDKGLYKGVQLGTERKFFGNPVAPMNGSFSFTFRFFKDFSLYALADWTSGGTIHNFTRQFITRFGGNGEFSELATQLGVSARFGIAPRTDVTALTPNSTEYKQAAEKFAQMDPTETGAADYYESSDNIRIREISLKYNMTSLLESIMPNTVKSVSLTLAARNVALFTSYTGPEVELNREGANRSVYRGHDFFTLQSPRTIYGMFSIGF
ncbi:MAG: TonB-dependent receptor [Bacteroidetes bacterium]|nr:TonB-dependent receptor [Bacteroidota bacterium]